MINLNFNCKNKMINKMKIFFRFLKNKRIFVILKEFQ